MPTEIADRLDITELYARLAHLLDEGRHDDAHTVYDGDATVRSPRAELRGLDEITAFLKRSAAETGEGTQHVNSDFVVRVTGDRAEATANQLVYFFRTGQAPHRMSGLRTDTTAVRTPAGWRFDSMRITLNWTQEKGEK